MSLPCRLPRLAVLIACALAVLSAGKARADDAPIASGNEAGGKLRADILSLKRTEGDTVTLRFALVNSSAQPFSMTLGNMRLIDLVNRRSYGPGVMSHSCRAEPGDRALCWAVFAAPNGSPKSVSVQFDENFELISIPLSN